MEAVILVEVLVLAAGIGLYLVAGYNFNQEAKKIKKAQEINRDQTNWWHSIEGERYNLRIIAVLILVIGHIVTLAMFDNIA